MRYAPLILLLACCVGGCASTQRTTEPSPGEVRGGGCGSGPPLPWWAVAGALLAMWVRGRQRAA